MSNFTSTEIYPYIVVYNNVFEDPERILQIVKNISQSEEPGIFEPWQKWYEYGQKIEEFGVKFNKFSKDLEITEDKIPKNKNQEDQRYFITELIKGFLLVNNDYIKRYNVDFDITEYVENKDKENSNLPEKIQRWSWTGPSLCLYHANMGVDENFSMNYHSDYIREPITSPGYKFTITTTTYLNDDYEDGGLDFISNNKLIGYKPKMGDFVVFPAGHPKILTEENHVYLHGVKKVLNKEKYFTRLYWMYYEQGSEEWFEQQDKYGREKWIGMQKEIMNNFRPPSKDISKCVRIM